MEFVSWDEYSQYMESHKIPRFQTTKHLVCIAVDLKKIEEVPSGYLTMV